MDVGVNTESLKMESFYKKQHFYFISELSMPSLSYVCTVFICLESFRLMPKKRKKEMYNVREK